ncbi:excalibur calcium-binding domain-containing protein [Aciduricibacillus chroicocephali]|uniref:Excalibur calcium-binding domain-containing protein n=1 Tax=Aciduricibacillus chroicocephali TaxID=3054939 RepID=A0ABY9KYP5_9BACI|nr:excalibur calcium-binding domain-containing protein [Bacillaceae bacterium 44XB]
MFKKICMAVVSLGLLLSLSFISTDVATAKAKYYQNCTELNKDYAGGVAKSSTTKNKGGKTRYKPYASKSLYETNKNKDRDKDGIACER